MTSPRRWLVVAALVAAVVLLPLAPRLLPAEETDQDPAALLALLAEAPDAGWSGYVETTGTLQLPATGDLDDLGSLLGETTRLRVWWRDADSWRVDRLLTAGESDLRHTDDVTVAYSYEAQEAEVSRDPDIRLPRTSDLLPSELARRFVVGADPAAFAADPGSYDVPDSVIGFLSGELGDPPGGWPEPFRTRALAGRTVRPAAADLVDVWLDPATGVPLLVEAYAEGSSSPALTSEVRDYDPGTPPASVVALDPTAGTDVERVDVRDIADAASQYAPLRPPDEVAGLDLQPSSRGAVGVYGQGLTQLVAIPLRDNEADPLREQVAVTPDAVATEDSIGALAGPLGVLVGGRAGDGGWLVAGTLDLDALRAAEADLRSGAVYLPEEDQ
ncbi:hypothetical protein [Nocardioides aquaticus]|uniref:hypothetical protein n=1 Tax=Nocardioides aquaticus TaxID=160826 RepID=UPI0031D468FF